MHARHQYSSEKKSEHCHRNSERQVKSICVRLFFSKRWQRRSHRAIDKKTRDAGKHRVPLEIAGNREDEKHDGKNHDGKVRCAKARMDLSEKRREISAFSHCKSDSWRVQHIRAETTVSRDQRSCGNNLDAKWRQKSPRGIHYG